MHSPSEKPFLDTQPCPRRSLRPCHRPQSRDQCVPLRCPSGASCSPQWARQSVSSRLSWPSALGRPCCTWGTAPGRGALPPLHRAALGWPWLTLISCYPCARYRPPPLAVPLAAGLTRELESWVDPRGTRDGKGQIHSRSCLCRAGVPCLMLQEPEKVRWVSKARGEPPAWGKRAQVISALTQRWPKYRGKPRNRHTICS